MLGRLALLFSLTWIIGLTEPVFSVGDHGVSWRDMVLLVGGLFFVAAIAMTGMPPLSGFIGKLLVLDGVRASAHASWFWALILSTSLIAIVGFSRAGSFVFWKAYALPAATWCW